MKRLGIIRSMPYYLLIIPLSYRQNSIPFRLNPKSKKDTEQLCTIMYDGELGAGIPLAGLMQKMFAQIWGDRSMGNLGTANKSSQAGV